ncbi:hypothetical protein [Nonomuraea zeae]|uniref:Uncharacterized protein n=1 Tax=Nonomuraea zeae TaxID=1642303 RepID=A0A5S4GUL9_9ACTN|nr:hypothetical protein [Nonomuraea zeae]TMR36442.1 hypothetical protein ETD85_10650 [Nonomuraea zeae]
MIPEQHQMGQGGRAALTALALGVTSLVIYALFSSGFGRPPHAVEETPQPVTVPLPAAKPSASPAAGSAAGSASDPAVSPAVGSASDSASGQEGSRPAAASAAEPSRLTAGGARLAVVSGDFWLTYLPPGLERSGGGTVKAEAGVEGGWARFGTGSRFVEARVERGTVAADWAAYRRRVAVLSPRAISVRGKPAVVGKHPSGGRVIVWLERAGTGAWIRVSDSLGKELVAIAASVKTPVGD